MKTDFTPGPSLYPFGPHWSGSYAGPMHYIDEGAGPR
jgi:haloalkane dehalogenase